MEAIYELLNLLSMIVTLAMIIGLIQPKFVLRWGEKRTRMRVFLYCGIGIFVLRILADVAMPESVKEEQRQVILERERQKEQETRERLRQAQVRIDQERLEDQERREQERQERARRERERQYVQATSLHQEFNENEVKAGNKYKGKLVRVHGIVKRISKDVLGSGITVHLKASEYFATVECQFSEEYAEELALLSSGQEIYIDGTCVGLITGRTVYVEECTIFRQ